MIVKRWLDDVEFRQLSPSAALDYVSCTHTNMAAHQEHRHIEHLYVSEA